jgi:hypothetical protein
MARRRVFDADGKRRRSDFGRRVLGLKIDFTQDYMTKEQILKVLGEAGLYDLERGFLIPPRNVPIRSWCLRMREWLRERSLLAETFYEYDPEVDAVDIPPRTVQPPPPELSLMSDLLREAAELVAEDLGEPDAG